MKGFNEGFVYRGRLVMCACGHAKKDHDFYMVDPYVKCKLCKCICYRRSKRNKAYRQQVKFKLHVYNGIAYWIKTTQD